ncbi:conserved hypothetical protein [Verticillium alfalfae VaMs.102]|uniref:Uncharacterized protein n=1 Tax=Verticillium alfalfae (strain VaMs.102 / ATCC MYA-4576 / FGSC 10136) TaxID=526221 RepID=C9SMJ3_VERA1|nr:conserved hypothetical protein [Verticillium alfalfae VaMs.102]EEY20008.1 conserved hypothetical protein [Verticillium alfalfae VaMs.102]
MATQTLHAHARQGSNTSSTMSMGMSYPPAPGSPTLTNPDMILPDYGGGSPDRSESPLMMWKNAHASDANYQSSSLNHFGSGPITPTTPIIYGNGTMLSDIGEVTEVESTVGKPSWPIAPRRHVTQPDSTKDTMLQPSPSVGLDAMKRRAKVQQLRRASIDSTSTVTTQGNNGHFADFDDDVSVDDSNFQGDDEESVAESHIDDTTARQAKFMPLPPGQGLGMNNENRHSTVSISQKAEEILANAKKRLTTMEGNLSRARTSLDTVSTPPHSSVGSGTPSPPIARSASAATSPSSAPGHFRMRSEVETNSDNAGDYTKRSASALGAAGGYRQPLPGSHSMGDLGRPYVRSKISQQPMLSTGLEPLGEENDPQMQSKRDSAVLDAFLSPTFGPYTQHQPDKGLTRSASVMQMRDIKDQVSDLKGKISSLREQARADSLKRRSLQSLRTPSPFTHAGTDQWYAGTIKPKRSDASFTPLGRNPWNGEMESVDGERMAQAETHAAQEYAIAPTAALDEQDDAESVISDYVAAQEALRAEDRLQTDSDGQEEYADDVDDMQTEDGFEDAEEGTFGDWDSESGESLYHDAPQTAVSHEDREDAFDYEHFFLHSAMGSFSQKRMKRRGSSSSFSSEDSVETTRGPSTSNADQVEATLRRRGSGDTMSTMDSFATATEGQSSRKNSDGEDEPQFAVARTTDVRTESPLTATRASFGPGISEDSSFSVQTSARPMRQRASSVIYSRPLNRPAASRSRPSISSLDSPATQRSFPLVNRRTFNGVPTPQGTPQGSPDPALKSLAESLMNDTASICGKDGETGDNVAIQQLAKEDQILVERLVASLGKCVLGLSESGRASAESRMYRRRIDAARKLLEGLESI